MRLYDILNNFHFFEGDKKPKSFSKKKEVPTESPKIKEPYGIRISNTFKKNFNAYPEKDKIRMNPFLKTALSYLETRNGGALNAIPGHRYKFHYYKGTNNKAGAFYLNGNTSVMFSYDEVNHIVSIDNVMGHSGYL